MVSPIPLDLPDARPDMRHFLLERTITEPALTEKPPK
jgi:hypothetical protein